MNLIISWVEVIGFNEIIDVSVDFNCESNIRPGFLPVDFLYWVLVDQEMAFSCLLYDQGPRIIPLSCLSSAAEYQISSIPQCW